MQTYVPLGFNDILQEYLVHNPIFTKLQMITFSSL